MGLLLGETRIFGGIAKMEEMEGNGMAECGFSLALSFHAFKDCLVNR